MSNRWKGGFIQAYFDPLTVGPALPFGPLYSWGYNNAYGAVRRRNSINGLPRADRVYQIGQK